MPLTRFILGQRESAMFDHAGTKRDGGSRTYKVIVERSAALAYLGGEEDYCLGADSRPGSAHMVTCAYGYVRLLRAAAGAA